MAYEMTDRENDTLVRGSSIEFVVDDEKDIGEVYLDGNLIFQEQEIYSDQQLREEFRRAFEIHEAEPDEDPTDMSGHLMMDDDGYDDEMESIEMDDDIDYDDPGLQEGLFTQGGEYATVEGREFIGDYHLHPKYGAMIGKYHGAKNHGRLIEIDLETVKELRIMGKEPLRAIDYTSTIENDSEDFDIGMDFDDIDGRVY